MSIFSCIIFLTVLMIRDGRSLPTKLQRRDVDLKLKENAESIKGDLPEKRALHPSAEQDLEASLKERSSPEYGLNKLLDPSKLEKKKINDERDVGERGKGEELLALQRESEINPPRNHKREEEQLNELSKARKNRSPELLVEENIDYHHPIHEEEEKHLSSRHEELQELPELEEEHESYQPIDDEEEDLPDYYEQELQELRAKEEKHEDHPPIKKKSGEEDRHKHYEDVLRELHPPEEDEEEEKENYTSVQHEKKQKERSHFKQKRTKHENEKAAVGDNDTLRERHPSEEGKHSETEIHPPAYQEKKGQHEISHLFHDRARKENVADEKGKDNKSNFEKKNMEHLSLSARHVQLDDNDSKVYGQHLQTHSSHEDSKYKRKVHEDVNDSHSEIKQRKHDVYVTQEEQDKNTREASTSNREQHKRNFDTRKEEKDDNEEHLPEETDSGNLTRLHEENGKFRKDHLLDHQTLDDTQTLAEKRELHLLSLEKQDDKDSDNERVMEEEESDDNAEGTYVLPKLQEEQDDESTVKRDHVIPLQLELNEPNQDKTDESEEEYLKKKRLIARLELISLMARNADVPNEAFDSEQFLGEDTNDGTNIKRISPPLQIKKSVKDVSFARRNGIEAFVEPMQAINDDEVSQVHAFEDKEDGHLNERDIMQNVLRKKKVKSICHSCCAVERCWMIHGLHCSC